jgi:hypothetical protein
MHEFESGADLRVAEEMMNPDGHRHDEEQGKGEARHRIAEEPAADGPRHDHVVGNVGGHQPEIHDRMQCPGEKHAPEPRVDGAHDTERGRQDLE